MYFNLSFSGFFITTKFKYIDSKVYVWNRQHAKLVESFSGHSATVNSVSWNPKNPRMFASASDDGSVKLWL